MYSLSPLVDQHDVTAFLLLTLFAIAMTFLFCMFVIMGFDEKPNVGKFGAVIVICIALIIESQMVRVFFKPLSVYKNEQIEGEFLGWQPEVTSTGKSVDHSIYGKFLVPEGEIVLRVPEGTPISKTMRLYRN